MALLHLHSISQLGRDIRVEKEPKMAVVPFKDLSCALPSGILVWLVLLM